MTPGPLLESDVHPDPFVQLARWFEQARGSGNLQPDAMALATATPDGRPSVRVVLYKGTDRGGLVFYTNARSRKGEELAANPRAAAVLHWVELHRQVRVEGAVEPLTREETEAYFGTRPRDAQISALASRQSRPVASRADLERAVARLDVEHQEGDVPMPEDWGGYRLVPGSFEFWQGSPVRLHDRLVYSRAGDDGWVIGRLQP